MTSLSRQDGQNLYAPDDQWKLLSVALDARRKQRGMSQAALARTAQVSESLIAKLVNGRGGGVWVSKLALVEKGLGWPTGTIRAVLDDELADEELALLSSARPLPDSLDELTGTSVAPAFDASASSSVSVEGTPDEVADDMVRSLASLSVEDRKIVHLLINRLAQDSR